VGHKNGDKMMKNRGRINCHAVIIFCQAARSEKFCNIHVVGQTKTNSVPGPGASKEHGCKGDQRRFSWKHN
jgi:hypothetical protein